MASKLPLIELI